MLVITICSGRRCGFHETTIFDHVEKERTLERSALEKRIVNSLGCRMKSVLLCLGGLGGGLDLRRSAHQVLVLLH